jgi:hypothetical protein
MCERLCEAVAPALESMKAAAAPAVSRVYEAAAPAADAAAAKLAKVLAELQLAALRAGPCTARACRPS